MRLLTHNYLKSNVRGTEKGYPLLIEVEAVLYEESPFDNEFIHNILKKIDYRTLVKAARQVLPQVIENGSIPASLLSDLPEQVENSSKATSSEGLELDPKVMQSLHKILLDVHVISGALICPDTGRRFPIKEGIPNMVLHEDEI